MDWNQITELPFFWVPFKSLPLTLIAVIVVPTLLAFIISYAMFKRRVGGVYFAIITQAVALILTVLIIGQQGYTGGVNGMTDLKTLLGWDIRTDSRQVHPLLTCALALLLGVHPARAAVISQQARHACCWRCATRKTACASPATTSPTSRSSSSAWRRPCRRIGGAMFTLQVGLHVAVLRRHRAVASRW